MVDKMCININFSYYRSNHNKADLLNSSTNIFLRYIVHCNFHILLKKKIPTKFLLCIFFSAFLCIINVCYDLHIVIKIQ